MSEPNLTFNRKRQSLIIHVGLQGCSHLADQCVTDGLIGCGHVGGKGRARYLMADQRCRRCKANHADVCAQPNRTEACLR